MRFNIKDLQLSSLQKERLAFLLGPRLKPNGKAKIVMKKYPTPVQNLKHLDEKFREILLEAMRAPNINHNEIKNPYTRQKKKRELGRTPEEREQALEDEFIRMRDQRRELHRVEQSTYSGDRRVDQIQEEVAKLRLELGFKETSEVNEDFTEMRYKQYDYEQMVSETNSDVYSRGHMQKVVEVLGTTKRDIENQVVTKENEWKRR